MKLQRAFDQPGGFCELPLLHTAGGLVGGDRLELELQGGPGSRSLLTTAAAQKVYGSAGRSRLHPAGQWARQQVTLTLASGSRLEWLPQEMVLYAGALMEQRLQVQLPGDAGFLAAEVVRLGRTAAGEGLEGGQWRSTLEICRIDRGQRRWELVDRLALGGAPLHSPHGLNGEPVFGSLVWAAPLPLRAADLQQLLEHCRQERHGLEGTMAVGALEQGLIARYRGGSTQAARFWFCRLWARLRAAAGLPPPVLPRLWPFQEQPWSTAPVQVEPFAAQGAATVIPCT